MNQPNTANPTELNLPSPLQEVPHPALAHRNIRLFVKRDDLIDPEISGNKWRKLKLNIAQAKHRGNDTVLTFGGAHSNHLAATAAASARAGLKSIGVVRGEDADLDNPTLRFARGKGMKLHPVSREEYRDAAGPAMRERLRTAFGAYYSIPEGGANHYGVQGCQDIMKEIDIQADRIFVACGTATTLSGMALANQGRSDIYGVSALKGGGFLVKNLENNIRDAYQDRDTERFVKEKVHLLLHHHFGGFAKTTDRLIEFMREFYRDTGIKTDPVYTAKAAYGMVEMGLKHQDVRPENWVFIHTGGMQGVAAMERRLGIEIYQNC